MSRRKPAWLPCMASANAQQSAATERSLTAMGVNPNDARFASSTKATEVANAARMAAGKNVARNEANNYQLNVAKDKVGTFTGQSNNAATQMGNAASGLGSLATSQSNNQLAQQQASSNNIGNAVGAGIAAYGIYNQPTTKKDGGRIKLPAGMKKVECHAMGGGVGSNQGFFQMQSIAPPPVAQAPQQGGSPVGSALGTANMIRGLYNAGPRRAARLPQRRSGSCCPEGRVVATKAGEQAGLQPTPLPGRSRCRASTTRSGTAATTPPRRWATTGHAAVLRLPLKQEPLLALASWPGLVLPALPWALQCRGWVRRWSPARCWTYGTQAVKSARRTRA